jgi:hypothetical protein
MIKSKPVGPAYEEAVVAAIGAYKKNGDLAAYEWALSKAAGAQDAAIARGGFPPGFRCSEGPHTAFRPHVAGIAQVTRYVRAGDVICRGHAVEDEARHE